MTILAQDTFTRANTTASTTITSGWGTASDSETWASAGATTTWQISSNEGTATGSSAPAYALLGSGTTGNDDAKVRFKITNTSDAVAILLRYSGTGNHYRFRATGNLLSIVLDHAGTATLTSAAITVSTNTFYWLRALAISSSLLLKFWQDGSSEPGTWKLSAADSTFATGQYGLLIDLNATSHIASFDSFQVNDTSGDVGAHLLISDGYGGVFS